MFSTASANAGETCQDWFARLKIKPDDPNCEMKCAVGSVDMSSFSCSSQCDRLCHQKEKTKCQLDTYWNNRLGGKTEPFSKRTGKELDDIRQVLSRMPEGFRPNTLKAIVRSSASVDIISSSMASSSDEYIILFSKAFLRPSDFPRTIAHEISHFLIENEWSGVFREYKQFSGWNSKDQGMKYRKGEFVDFDGKFSAEEDLANNIEFYLFDHQTLKSKSPKIFDWIKSKLGPVLKLEKGCPDGK
jgi:hypothetical protein